MYRKLVLRFLSNKTETFYVSVTHLILRFGIVQNKFQQKNKTEINHIIDSHIKFEVSLHFLGNWPTVWCLLMSFTYYLEICAGSLFAS